MRQLKLGSVLISGAVTVSLPETKSANTRESSCDTNVETIKTNPKLTEASD